MGSRRRWLLAVSLAAALGPLLCTISWLHVVKSRAHAELISARSQLKFRRLQLTDQAAPSVGIISAVEAAANPLALSTLKPACVAVAPANTRDDKRLTAVRNKLRQTKAELDTLLAARAKQTIKETLSVTPIKDELQKQGNIQAEPEC